MARATAKQAQGARPAARADDLLRRYREKRDFAATPEPPDVAAAGEAAPGAGAELAYVIQKHDATRLHYDFRLELDGVLLSWAVPKGPSLDPTVRRMAVRTEDHPLAYAGFEGTIPAGHYGAGRVIVWDRGHWRPEGDARAGLAAGKLAFTIDGEKLHGRWELVRMKPKDGERQEAWLLFKKRDEHARPAAELDIVTAPPDSVNHRSAATGRGHRPATTPKKNGSAAAAAPGPAAALPAKLEPQLALLATAVPDAGHWFFETKFDGYRLLARIDAEGRAQLLTRGGHDWTAKMPALAAAVDALEARSAWLDGEIVVGGPQGAGDFNALQNAFDRARGPRGAPRRTDAPIVYMLFDLPFFDGHDLRDAPLEQRRALLAQLLAPHPAGPLRFSTALGEGGAEVAARLLTSACEAGLEGLIAKRADAPYRSTRSGAWLKLKCHQRQEFVVAGYTERSDDASAIGSLVLGVYDDAGALRPAGSVGTGWDVATARALRERLHELEVDAAPFADGAPAAGRWGRRRAGEERWVAPRTVVEVRFAEWTPAGHVRHAAFEGLRSDKPARAVRREQPVAPSDAQIGAVAEARSEAVRTATGEPAAKRHAMPAGVNVTHGERVIDRVSGRTKLDLVRYVDSIADAMLPHLAGRPVALLRAPRGVEATVFFQKHATKAAFPGLRQLDAALWPGHEPLLEIRTREALLAAAQMNVVEFHPWNSTVKSIAKPDRMVFDLDPGEGVAFAAVREGAQLVRTLLQELGLESWLKTSGGKGLHLVVPIAPRWPFATVKALSKAAVEHLARTVPSRFVAKSGPSNRPGKIFVDYLRNGEGATTVAPWSPRARPGLGVSMPIDWDELASVRNAAQWTIANARDRLSLQQADPWSALAGTRQSLVGAMKTLCVTTKK